MRREPVHSKKETCYKRERASCSARASILMIPRKNKYHNSPSCQLLKAKCVLTEPDRRRMCSWSCQTWRAIFSISLKPDPQITGGPAAEGFSHVSSLTASSTASADLPVLSGLHSKCRSRTSFQVSTCSEQRFGPWLLQLSI